MDDQCFCVTGGGPTLCLVWRVRRVGAGARKKVQLQLHRSSSPTAGCGLRTSYGKCRPLWNHSAFLFHTVVTFYQSNVLRLVFACRGFVLDMTTDIETSAVMSTSCVPLKEASSCPFSSFLGMLSVSKQFNETHDMRSVKKLPFGCLLTKYCLSSKNRIKAGV